MNSQEIQEWKSTTDNKYFNHLIGLHIIGKWKVRIRYNTFKQLCISITGYNNMTFGTYGLDNGMLAPNNYYPTIYFYNEFTKYKDNYNIGSPLCLSYKIDLSKPITPELLVSIAEMSWNIITEFLNK